LNIVELVGIVVGYLDKVDIIDIVGYS